MDIFLDITLVLSLAALVLYVCLRLNIPTIVAFLVAGMIAGPHGIALVTSVHEVEMIAEVGVLLLLFTIGIEFSLEKLISSQKYILLGGSLQMVITIVTFFGLSMLLSVPWNQALFIGFLFSLSSTAIVMQLFQDTNQLESFHGKFSLSVLIFQDVAIVPLILVLPWISGKPFETIDLLKLLAGIAIVTVVIVASRKFMPQLILKVVHTRNRELFLLFIIVVCFLTAMMTYKTGLSLALGAFLAGLIISESEFSLEALNNILPLKKIFTSIFFISVGMLLDIRVIIEHPVQIIGITGAVMVIKTIIMLLTGWLLRLPRRSVWIASLAMCQVGEFAFVLSQQGSEFSLLSDYLSQLFLSVSVISMGLSPFIIMAAPKIASKITGGRILAKKTSSSNLDEDQTDKLKDHLVIIGYGMNGRNVARAAKEANIPHVIVDYNPETYKKERKKRQNFIYGDATNPDVLKTANIQEARIAVVATHDPIATEMIVSAVRKMSPIVRLIVRTRFMREIDELKRIGASEVIPEEFETSIEIFTRVLKYYLVPEDDIEKFVNDIRKENYEMLRRLVSGTPDHIIPFLSTVEVIKLNVPKGSEWAEKSIEQIKLGKKYRVNLLAIEREENYIHTPSASTVIHAGDVLVVIVKPEDLASIKEFANPLKLKGKS